MRGVAKRAIKAAHWPIVLHASQGHRPVDHSHCTIEDQGHLSCCPFTKNGVRNQVVALSAAAASQAKLFGEHGEIPSSLRRTPQGSIRANSSCQGRCADRLRSRLFNGCIVEVQIPLIALLAEEAVGRIAGEVDNKNLRDGHTQVEARILAIFWKIQRQEPIPAHRRRRHHLEAQREVTNLRERSLRERCVENRWSQIPP
mmetsp:Transcript_9681/g.23001  ORF Transcript_9681/g.23001 Transcript_9681/m.23001 type:complete len:200 (-) Transcript_9681:337-936(-)